MKTRNVLYIVPSANIGGAETFIQHCAKFHKNYQPIFALLRDGVLSSWLKTHGFEYYIVPHPPRLRNIISQMQCLKWLKQLVKRHDIGLIHSSMAYGALFGGPLSKMTGIPHLWFQHGPAAGLIDTLAGSLPHQYLLVNSNYTKNAQLSLEQKIPKALKPKRELNVFPLGVDLQEVENIEKTQDIEKDRKELGLDKTPLVAGMVCRLQEWKGVHVFVRAIEEANKRRPVCGVVWGGLNSSNESEGYKKNLEKTIAEEKIPVLLAGPTTNPLKAYALIDIIVNASTRAEPFGLSIIEGMCMGAWPIVPNEGGPIEILEKSQIGTSFKSCDVMDLADKLINFEKIDKEKIKLEARSLFNAENSINYLETIYDSIFFTNNQK